MPAVALGLVPFLGHVPLLLAAMVAAGLGLGLGQPLTLTWVASAAPRHFRGAALGVRVAGNRLAQLAVPGAAGALAGGLGIGAAFVAVAGLLSVCAGVLQRTGFGREGPVA